MMLSGEPSICGDAGFGFRITVCSPEQFGISLIQLWISGVDQSIVAVTPLCLYSVDMYFCTSRTWYCSQTLCLIDALVAPGLISFALHSEVTVVCWQPLWNVGLTSMVASWIGPRAWRIQL